MTRLIALATLAMGTTGCAVATDAGAPDITRIAQPGAGSVNSYVIETDDGVVVIDAQRSLSAAREVVAAIEATAKPLLAVLITHPHPDHFGGLAAVIDAFPDTPVYASPGTLEEMETDGYGLMAATQAALPDDTPEVFALPDRTFADEEGLEFGGLRLLVHEIGAGESKTMSMFFAPGLDALFVGDVVGYEMTSFLLEQRTGAWLEQLATVRGRYADTSPTIYPGHGAHGPFDALLSWQTDWLKTVRSETAARVEDGVLDEADLAAVTEAMRAAYGDLPPVAAIPTLMQLNVEAVSQELQRDD